MIRFCPACPPDKAVIAEVSPLADKRRIEAPCRLHELERLENAKMITPVEIQELTTIRYEMRKAGQ